MKTISAVRPSSIAGRWYPRDPASLSAEVDGYIQAAQAGLPEIEGQIVAVMVPHAGHLYSGPVAGYAFAALQGLHPDLVVVASPMHYPYPNPLLTTAHQAYATPLGEIPVDADALDQLDAALVDSLGTGLARVANDPEHSLEIELPFLQRLFGSHFHLLPVMVRDQGAAVARALGSALAHIAAGKNALLVASTDLSHFYPQQVALTLDGTILDRVGALDPAGVLQAEEEGRGFACGRGALAAIMWAALELGAEQATVLRHATSGDVTGDYQGVVGYGAAVFTKK